MDVKLSTCFWVIIYKNIRLYGTDKFNFHFDEFSKHIDISIIDPVFNCT